MFCKSLSPREAHAFFQGLHALLGAGLTLLTALALLEREEKRLAPSLRLIMASLREGQAFSAALGQHLVLPPMVGVTLRVGESSGDLAQACQICANTLADQQSWKRILWQISFYPALLILTSLALCWVMMGFVLPEFASLYRTLNLALPPSTAWLLVLADKAPALMETGVILILSMILLISLLWKSPQGRYSLESTCLRVRWLNTLLVRSWEYQFSLQLGTLLGAGCTLSESLHTLRLGTQSPVLRDTAAQMDQRIRLGQPLSQSLCQPPLDHPRFTALISHAEQTGHLDEVLLNLAKQHKLTLGLWQDRAKHLIQPIITLVMGGFLGAWILLLYYPMLQLGTNI